MRNTLPASLRQWGTRCAAAWLLSFGAMLPALAATSGHKAGTAVFVGIDGFAFTPSEITVTPGTTVTWANHDQVPHTVTAKDKGGELSSQALDTDDTYAHTFTRPGDYAYYCTVHPFMTGVVHVRE